MRALLLLVLAACATTPSSSSNLAPHPFSAEQIRDATKPGRTYRFSLETPKGPIERTTRFTQVGPEEVTTETTGGTEVEVKTTTWAELMSHADYPADATVITDEDVEVPAGKFACMKYVVTGPKGVTRAWFAKSLPGAPVRLELEENGARSLTMVLVEHTPGK